MLTIRHPQIAALPTDSEQDAAFVRWAVGHLRRSCPRQTAALGDDQLHWRAQAGLRRARRAGFSEPELVADFLELMVRHAPDFDEHPVVQRALRRAVPRSLVLLSLTAAVDTNTWTEIRAGSDPSAWET